MAPTTSFSQLNPDLNSRKRSGFGNRPRTPNRTLAQWAWAASKKLWAPFDFAGAILAVSFANYLAPPMGDPAITNRPLTALLIHAFGLVALLYLAKMYDRNILIRPLHMILRTFAVSGLATLLTLGCFYLLFFQPIGRWVAGYVFVFSALVTALPRIVFWRLIRRRRRRILFLRETPLVRELVAKMRTDYSTLYKVMEIFDQEDDSRWKEMGPEKIQKFLETIRSRGIDEIVLPMDSRPMEQSLGPSLACASMGCQVRTVADLFEEVFRRVPVSSEITLAWLFGFGWDSTNHFQSAIKRISDLALASAVLLITSPVWLLTGLSLKLFGNGPVFYTQWRVGHYGRPFRILKFRTMVPDSENGKPQWAGKNDARLMPLGKIMRRLRIDELPQLLNIIAGQMSFVGPRPERPGITEKLEEEIPYYSFRHLVRPGLTGWAQVNYRYGASVEDSRRKLEYDLYYVRHYSLQMDLAIVLRTLVTFAKGAR